MSDGERSLEILLRDMNPRLHEGEFVFTQAAGIPAGAIATFQEEEGLTVIIARQRADALALPYSYVAAWITLTVHSDLAAVGFLAAVSARLAAAGISCNVISALLHDHLFVPFDRRHEAMRALSGAHAGPS
jgi:hypothetical protein